jgi:diguanylate cyclase (GGDEF)-like protein
MAETHHPLHPEDQQILDANHALSDVTIELQMLQAMLNGLEQLVLRVDSQTYAITYASQSVILFFGQSLDELLGRSLSQWIVEEHAEILNDLLLTHTQCALKLRRTHHKSLWVRATCQIFSMNASELLVTFNDVDEQKRIENYLSTLVWTDSLTGLMNRNALFEQLSIRCEQGQIKPASFAVLTLDIDRFKQVNDEFGPGCGDEYLTEIALRLRKLMRSHDVLARMGNDEFIIVTDCIDSAVQLDSFVKQMLHVLQAHLQLGTFDLHPKISIGASFYPQHATEVTGLIETSAKALRQAKYAGGNQCRVFEDSLRTQAQHSFLAMEATINEALEKQRFVLMLQPIVSAQSRRIVAAEALVRMLDQNGKMIPPLDFIPIAEATNLIVEIGRWVLWQACQYAAELDRNGFPIKIAVNVSNKQFASPDLIGHVGYALADAELNPALLELEITESTLMDDMGFVTKTLSFFAEQGISLAVDDFGTGFSSFGYLKTFTFLNKLKIDRSFVSGVPEYKKDCAIASSIIDLGHHLELNVVAEGVETAMQANYLSLIGCNYLQGYYFSRPLPFAALKGLLMTDI